MSCVWLDYIDSATNYYEGFRWGIPCNLKPVPPEFNFATYGEEEFPFYCNGGIFTQDVVYGLKAFSKAGLTDKAQKIKEQIYKRQHEGMFENGSGFAAGVVNRYGEAYSILKWDGTPTDYEGIISRDCAFLSYTLIQVPDIAEKLYQVTEKAKTSVYDGSLGKSNPIAVKQDYQLENFDSDKAYWFQDYPLWWYPDYHVIDTEIKTEGKGSVKLPGTVSAVYKTSLKLPSVLENYAVTLWIKSKGVTKVADARLELSSQTWRDQDNKFVWCLNHFIDNTDWKKVTLKFSDTNFAHRGDVNQNPFKFLWLRIDADGEIWVDDLRIVDLRYSK